MLGPTVLMAGLLGIGLPMLLVLASHASRPEFIESAMSLVSAASGSTIYNRCAPPL